MFIRNIGIYLQVYTALQPAVGTSDLTRFILFIPTISFIAVNITFETNYIHPYTFSRNLTVTVNY
jgi:hypothetical protein